MRARGWLFLLAVILVAKINGVFADVRNLLVLAELCKHDHGNICLCWATFGKQFCPSGASTLPHMGKHRAHFKPESVVRACLYFVFLEECILFGF